MKAMFRTRGESSRIKVADALGRQYYQGLNLGKKFEMALGAMGHCRDIRNRYAHCNWWDDQSGKLAFANLEDVAKSNDLVADLWTLTTYYAELPLLQQEEAYYIYTDQLLAWVNYEGRCRAGKLVNQVLQEPKPMKRPPIPDRKK